jgi:hypothetical protein
VCCIKGRIYARDLIIAKNGEAINGMVKQVQLRYSLVGGNLAVDFCEIIELCVK